MKYLFVIFTPIIFLTVATGQNYSRDRVYTGNQVSNTVSVIDPSTNTLLGEIPLGKPHPNALAPLYRGQSLVHGLRYDEKRKILAVVSIGSNSITFISTRDNSILKTVYIGRAPHEPTFTPDGKECWVTVRGEAYISVIDMVTMEEKRKIPVADGPGMICFTKNGKYAFVCSSFSPVVNVVSTATYKSVKSIPVVSPFSPNIFTSDDGKWISMTQKDIGKVTLIDPDKMEVVKVLNTGALTNHVTFSSPAGKLLLSVTVGGENCMKIYDVASGFREVAVIPLGTLPHGLWSTPDGKSMYVGLEYADQVQPIDMLNFKALPPIPIGQSPQALLYAANAVDKAGDRAGLQPLLATSTTQVVVLNSAVKESTAKGQLAIRSIGQTDLIEQQFSNLAPGEKYTLLFAYNNIPDSNSYEVNAFLADANGKYAGQSTGMSKSRTTRKAPYIYILLFNETSNKVVMIKKVSE